MRKIILIVWVLVSFGFTKYDSVSKSIVVKRLSSCDYFILYNSRGYVVAEHYSGHEFNEGETVYGNINGYSFKYIYDEDIDENKRERIYVENYG